MNETTIDTLDDLITDECFTGAPPFYDLPDDVREKVEGQVQRAERMFWLRVTNLEKTPVTEALLRRAVYAEQRCWEMENMLAEMALIAKGAGQTVKDLAEGINDEDIMAAVEDADGRE